LGDIMRGNKDVALATGSANAYLIDYTGTLPTITANCFTGACTTTLAVAQFDMNQWLARVSAALPQARVVVCFDDTPYGSSTGQPQWACNSAANQTLVVKIGWTQQALRASDALIKASDGQPGVVLPLIAGSSS
jgi:type IV pilus assembly protein PilV